MKLICIAEVNLKEYKEKMDVYSTEYNKYAHHRQQMEESETYRLSNADLVIEEPKRPEPDTGEIQCNIRKDCIIGYEVTDAEKEVIVLTDFSKTGQHAYLIKYDDKIIEQLDNLLE